MIFLVALLYIQISLALSDIKFNEFNLNKQSKNFMQFIESNRLSSIQENTIRSLEDYSEDPDPGFSGSCRDINSNCIECEDSTCRACEENFVLEDNGECRAITSGDECPNHCISCNKNSICLRCEDNYLIKNNKCKKIKGGSINISFSSEGLTPGAKILNLNSIKDSQGKLEYILKLNSNKYNISIKNGFVIITNVARFRRRQLDEDNITNNDQYNTISFDVGFTEIIDTFKDIFKSCDKNIKYEELDITGLNVDDSDATIDGIIPKNIDNLNNFKIIYTKGISGLDDNDSKYTGILTASHAILSECYSSYRVDYGSSDHILKRIGVECDYNNGHYQYYLYAKKTDYDNIIKNNEGSKSLNYYKENTFNTIGLDLNEERLLDKSIQSKSSYLSILIIAYIIYIFIF